jgi:hypothetical protein
MKTALLVFAALAAILYGGTGPVPVRKQAETLTGTVSQRQQTYWSDRQPTLGGEPAGQPSQIGRVVDETVLAVDWKGEKRVFVLEGVLSKTIAK